MTTVEDMRRGGFYPAWLFDANDRRIDRLVTAFDPETGEVESCVVDARGRVVFEGDCIKRRIEVFPAPLIAQLK